MLRGRTNLKLVLLRLPNEVPDDIRSRGNRDTELRLIALMRANGIAGWPRGAKLMGGRTENSGRRSEDRRQMAGDSRMARFSVRPDFVFPKRTLAVFVDGCFWHGCPIHGTKPKQNAKFWREKIARNKARDRLVTRTLRAGALSGRSRSDGRWRVLRIWEHELSRKNEPKAVRRIQRALVG